MAKALPNKIKETCEKLCHEYDSSLRPLYNQVSALVSSGIVASIFLLIRSEKKKRNYSEKVSTTRIRQFSSHAISAWAPLNSALKSYVNRCPLGLNRWLKKELQ